MGNCLLETIRQRTGHKVESKDPLFVWAYVHAGFLISRFAVHQDGCTSHELVHGRPFSQKLCPFGSAVYAQVLPKNKNKGEPWRQFVWLGRTDLGQLRVLGSATGIQFARTVRRSPKEYDLELLEIMKGIPWDFALEVVATKKGKANGERVPIVLDGPPASHAQPIDEAASDLPSHGAGVQLASPSGSAPSSMSVSLPGESGSASPMSEKLIPAGSVNASRVESKMPTGHEPDLLDLFDNDSFFEEEGVDWELDNILSEADRRAYEDGPPNLNPELLAKLDLEMDKVEEERLLKMGVLKLLQDAARKADMYQLSFKFVHDWRFRDKWVRRSRMVARECQFLQPDMEDLYSPALLASL